MVLNSRSTLGLASGICIIAGNKETILGGKYIYF